MEDGTNAENYVNHLTVFGEMFGEGLFAKSQIYLDTPGRNPDAFSIAESYGMKEVFRTTRMYNRPEPGFPLEKWFGVTSFELG